MANANELVCPKTGEACQFYGYCHTAQANLESTHPINSRLRAILDSATRPIPEPLRVADMSSFCSEQRIDAIGAAALGMLEDPGLDDIDGQSIKRWAASFAQGILENRLRLAYTPLPDVERFTIASRDTEEELADIVAPLFERFKHRVAVADVEAYREHLGEDVVKVGNLLLNAPEPLSMQQIHEQAGIPFTQACEAFADLNHLLTGDGPYRLSVSREDGAPRFQILKNEVAQPEAG